jgi:multiple sugar transport system permease protein
METLYGFKRRNPLGVTLIIIILIIFTVWTLVPILWAGITAFKNPGDSLKPTFIPFKQFQPTLYAWEEAFITQGDRTFQAIRNSVIVATCSAAAALLLGALAGYSLARYRFYKWKNKGIALWILSQRMFPPVAVIIPYFLIMQRLRLVDNILAIIIIHIAVNLPLAAWLMLDYFAELPRDIEEAALIDGCGYLQAFFKIALPIAAPGLVAVYVLSFIFSWNEFIFVITFGYQNAMTLSVMIAGALTIVGIYFYRIAALSLLSIIPPVVLALVLSRFLVRGLTMGALKE